MPFAILSLLLGKPIQKLTPNSSNKAGNRPRTPKIGNSSLYAQEFYEQGLEEVVDCVSMELDGCWFKYSKDKQMLEVKTITKKLRIESLKLHR